MIIRIAEIVKQLLKIRIVAFPALSRRKVCIDIHFSGWLNGFQRTNSGSRFFDLVHITNDLIINLVKLVVGRHGHHLNGDTLNPVKLYSSQVYYTRVL